MKIALRGIKLLDVFERFYESQAQNISRIHFIAAVAHSNGHSKGVALPVKQLLRLSIVGFATVNNE